MTNAANPTPEAASSPFTPEMIAEVFDGAPPATIETAADKADEQAPPEPKEKSAAERILAATRAENRAIRERESRAVRDREAESKLDARSRELEERERKLRDIEEGRDPDAVREHLERLAKVTKPEAVAEKKLTAQEQRIKDLEDKLAAGERAKSADAAAAQAVEAKRAFVEDVERDADKYVHLTQEFSKEEAADMALSSLHDVLGRTREGKPVTRIEAFVAANGRGPTHDEIALYLDGIAKKRIEARASTSWRKNDNALQGSQPASGDPQAPSAKGNSPRTLSRADTSQRAAAPRSNAWSQEAADEESRRILEKALRKG